MVTQSSEQCDSTTDAEPTPATNSTPLGLKSEDVPGPHTEKLTGVQEASGPDTAPTESSRSQGRRAALGRLRHFVTWAPKNCRYDPNEPPKFSLSLNLLFALVRFRLVPNATHVDGLLTLFNCPGRHDHRGELVLRPANLVQDCRYI